MYGFSKRASSNYQHVFAHEYFERGNTKKLSLMKRKRVVAREGRTTIDSLCEKAAALAAECGMANARLNVVEHRIWAATEACFLIEAAHEELWKALPPALSNPYRGQHALAASAEAVGLRAQGVFNGLAGPAGFAGVPNNEQQACPSAAVVNTAEDTTGEPNAKRQRESC